MAQQNYLILSCDGGGIRGLIPALLVQQLDRELDFLNRVNLFAGTSTGGVIALGLASKVDISNIVDIYMTKGAEIFKRHKFFSMATAKAGRTVAQPKALTQMYPKAAALPGNLLHVKYSAAGLKNLISKTYPATLKLSELKRKVLVTALELYEATQRKWVPTCLTNLPGSQTADISVLDAALATSAAPMYFPPHVYVQDGIRRAFADGGIFANNPSMLAAASVIASDILKERKLARENVKVLSIGTGFTLNGMPKRRLLRPEWYGVLAWLSPSAWPPSTPQFPLLAALMDSVSDIDSFQCHQILGDNFRRANVQLTPEIDLDDHDKVCELKRITDLYMASTEWREIKQWIGSKFV